MQTKMAEAKKVFESLMDKVGFAAHIAVLVKATAEDEQPTPPYLYSEINKISHESDGASQCLLDYLLDRLQHKSPFVRLKVLRVMKELVQGGHSDFRNDLRKKSAIIQQCSGFSGPPDALRGNAPYVSVRQAANELLQILFDLDSQTRTSQTSAAPMMGIGSGRSQKMPGFGSTRYSTQKTVGSSIVSGLQSLADMVIDSGDNRTFNVEKTQTNIGLYNPAQLMAHSGSSQPLQQQQEQQQQQQRTSRRKKARVVGRALGGWESDEDQEPTDTVSSGSSDPAAACERLEAESSDWSSECHLVESYLAGTMSLPAREEINSFINTLTSCTHNCEKAVEFLRDRLLDHNNPSVNLRIMLALEAVLRKDLMSVDVLGHLFAQKLLFFLLSPCQPEKSKARKLIRIMEKLTSNPEVFCSGTDSGQLSNKTGDSSSIHEITDNSIQVKP